MLIYSKAMARDLTKSPFPGMDPYLERYWGDVHHRLCTYSCDQLRRVLPPGLIPRLDERTFVQADDRQDRDIIPDVRVVDYGGPGGAIATSPPALNEPFIVESDSDPITEGFVQVLDSRDGNRIITVIEFASPVNKVSAFGREKYRRKRYELLYTGVSIVEVDLIRAGTWNLKAPMSKIGNDRKGHYHISVTRGWNETKSEVYAIRLADRLPIVRIPLRRTDTDAALDLQVVFDQVYENGSYGYDVDYTKPPVPPLNDSDNAWASDWLSTRL